MEKRVDSEVTIMDTCNECGCHYATVRSEITRWQGKIIKADRFVFCQDCGCEN